MMRASGNSPRIALIASTPLISGICRSISVTSGRCVRNCCTASRPFVASATSLKSACAETNPAIPWRISGWSSTDMIRIGLSVVISRPRLRCAWFGVGARGRDDELDLGARIPCTPEREFSADELGPLAHAAQPVMPCPPTFGQHFLINTLTVVENPQSKLPLVVPQLHLDSCSLRMLKGIAQRLTRNPVDLISDDGMQKPNGSRRANSQGRHLT